MSLRDDLSAAFDAQEAGEETPAPAAAQAAAGGDLAPVEGADTGGEPAAQAGQPRDNTGKFAKAGENRYSDTAQGAEPAQPTIRPPNSWKATAKAKFATLEPEVQQEILRREKDIEDGKAQWDSQAAQYKRFSDLVAPHRDQWAAQGVDEVQAIQQLLAASDWLNREPAAALSYLARQYGVGPQQFAQSAMAQQAQQPQLPPALQPILQEFQTLQQKVSTWEAGQQKQQDQAIQSDITAFERDPANLYFANVREDMAVLLREGRANDLKDAYDKATWANPEIRQLLMAEQQQKAGQAAQAQKAQRANVSVTGSPSGPGAVSGAAPKSTREALLQAWDEQAA